MANSPPEGVETAKITVTEVVLDDDVVIMLEVEPEDLALVHILGMLRFAEDGAIRDSIGEADDE
jgi:hypothetical protein